MQTEISESFNDLSRADLYAPAFQDLLSSTDAEEEALNTISGQAGPTSVKRVLIVGVGFFLIAVLITLVALSVNLSNTFEVALS